MREDVGGLTLSWPDHLNVLVVERLQPGGTKIVDVYVDAGDVGEEAELAAGRQDHLHPSGAVEVCRECGRPLACVPDCHDVADGGDGLYRHDDASGLLTKAASPGLADSHSAEDGDA